MPSRSHNYESNGPEGRIRGNASQVYEKYLQLARDTQPGGDRVLAESFMQHAEHYYRILNESTDSNNRPQHQREARHEEQVQRRDHGAGQGTDRGADHGGDHGADEEDQLNGYGGEQQPLAPARSVSRFDDRRQEARSGDPRYAEAKSAEQDAESAGPVQEPVAPAADAKETAAAATSAAVEGQDEKSEAEPAKPVRRTRRSPTRRTTKSKSDEALGGDEDAGLLKMLGESSRTNGSGTQKAEPAAETPVEAAAETAPETVPETAATESPEQPVEEAEAKPAPKPRRRRTTKSSSEAANVDA